MTLLTDIVDWASANLLPWQRDALRRLFQHQKCTSQDIDDLYAMLKSARGLPDTQNRQPIPLALQHLPAQSATSGIVVLAVMRDLKHVNRIAANQQLTFAPQGMTIIYGGNGSGKSGYSRVLKRACRARDASESVHADASDPHSHKNTPEATFDIVIDKTPKTLHWKRDSAPPDELSTIAVFDGLCARAYLDEQDVAYLPYGLDILETLGQTVLPELSNRLHAEILSINTDVTPFADLLGNTSVGKLIASISEATPLKQVNALATLDSVETARLGELDRTLAEPDPKAKAKVVRISAQRIDNLISRIDTNIQQVDDASVLKLKSCDNETEAAIKAENLAASSLRANEPLLPGTGDQVWKTLFEAAHRFSVESAYPGESFPHTCPEAKCPLCQQTLDEDAAKRLQRFEEFIKQETATVAKDKRQQRTLAVDKITKASLDFGIDAATGEELTLLDASLLQTVREFEKKIEIRRKWIIEALTTHAWDAPSHLDGDPRQDLHALRTNMLSQANDLENASDESHKKALENERAELRARHSLSLRSLAVQDLISRMQIKATLTKCKDDLKTKSISDKAKEFASQAVTAALRNALNAEFEALGIAHINTKLVERVEKLKMKLKLVLDLPVSTKLDQILSEGEQRAIAIGSFLAELKLSGHGGGIVFDDPVSSLDHNRRKKVARRLVEEAKKRQVIVLTHETVFLCELLDAVEQEHVEHLVHHLEWINNHPGHVVEGLPWEHMDYKERLKTLEEEQQKLEPNWPAYPNEQDRTKMRRQYSLLRATIERIIQDVVFNKVLHRYRDRISMDRLNDVVGFTEPEFKEIERLHKTCCEVTDAHDPSSEKNDPVPSAKQLANDIAAVRAIVKVIKDRRKKAAI